MLVHPILVTRDLTVLFHRSMGVTLASVPVATSDLSVTLTSTNVMRALLVNTAGPVLTCPARTDAIACQGSRDDAAR